MSALALRRRPVAVGFPNTAPESLDRFQGSAPSGCSFWGYAANGDSFSTVPEDHYNCPIGSYTHNIPLPDKRAHELPAILQVMTDAGYVRMEEIPGIPVLPETPKYVAYAPLGETPFDPEVVLIVGTPGKLMMLEEAALRAGAASKLPLLARPTCMAIPASMTSGLVMSAGCIGNRVYTGISDDELYAAIPGKDLERICNELKTIVSANAMLERYHQGRKGTQLPL